MKVAESENETVDSEEVPDCDICDEIEINKIFNLKCEPITNKIINESKYILHIDGTSNSTPNIIVGLSDNTAEIYNLSNNQLAKLQSFEFDENVIGVKASVENENIFYVGSKNCQIKILDLRDDKCKRLFKDTTLEVEENFKPLNCFDVSSNSLLLCGGTDVYCGDAYMLFWDIRNTKLLGAYWDSHTDDITQVAFHPSDVNKLISGSTDGLINIYDLSQISEDEGLIDSLNTESSVEQLCWYMEGRTDKISCVTHMHDVQIWRMDDAEPYSHFRRDTIAKQLKRKLEDYCYIASTHVDRNNKLFLLSGSNYGNGECLRALEVNKKELLPLFNVKTNKQIVRCSWLNNNGDILVTAGENGNIDVWNIQTNCKF